MGRWLLDQLIRHGMAWSLATWVLKGLEYVIPPYFFLLCTFVLDSWCIPRKCEVIGEVISLEKYR